MSKIRKAINKDNTIQYNFYCPGCKCYHGFNEKWTWNNDYEKPTVSPSLLTTGQIRCHSFIENGIIRFLNDSEHELAGQTVELPIID